MLAIDKEVLHDKNRSEAFDLSRKSLSLDLKIESLPCREEEIDHMSQFVRLVPDQESYVCCYTYLTKCSDVSGMPGTGKTACTRQVIRELHARKDRFSNFHFIELNALTLSHPNEAYAVVLSKIIEANAGFGGPDLADISDIPSRDQAYEAEEAADLEIEDVQEAEIPQKRRGRRIGTKPLGRRKANNDASAAGLLYLPPISFTQTRQAEEDMRALPAKERVAKLALRQVSTMTHQQAYMKLNQYFSTVDTKRQHVVLLLDEVDYLVTKEQKVLYSFLDWPSRAAAKLCVIAVANTLDLPGRLNSRIQSRLGVASLNFRAYSRDQLIKIVEDRIAQAVKSCSSTVFGRAMEDQAVKMCAMHVSNSTADVRRMLQFCRRSLDISTQRIQEALLEYENMSSKDKKALEVDSTYANQWARRMNPRVTPADINTAMREGTSTTMDQSISSSPLAWRLFLLAVLVTGKSESIKERWTLVDSTVVVSSDAVWSRFKTFCSTKLQGPSPTVADFCFVAQQLTSVGLLEILPSKIVQEAQPVRGTDAELEAIGYEEIGAPLHDDDDNDLEITGTSKESAFTKQSKMLITKNKSVAYLEKLLKERPKEIEASDDFVLAAPQGVTAYRLGSMKEEALRLIFQNDEDMPRIQYLARD